MDETGRPVRNDNGAPARRQVRGPRLQWTKALTGTFLDTLAATGNIAEAARRVGIDSAQAYYRARTNAAFAEGWAAAIEAGYQTVEIRLIGHVLGSDEAASAKAEGRPTFDWEQGLRLMTMRDTQRKTGGGARRGGPPRQVATREETDAAILQRLARLAARAKRAGDGA